MALKKESIIASTIKEILEKKEDRRTKKDMVILALFNYLKTTKAGFRRLIALNEGKWTDFELFYIVENAGKIPIDEILTFFKESGSVRTSEAIIKKIERLGLMSKYRNLP